MDALSMLLEDIHLYQTQYHYINATGEWSFELDKKDCIVFYLVTTGGISIKVDDVYRNAHAPMWSWCQAAKNTLFVVWGNRISHQLTLPRY